MLAAFLAIIGRDVRLSLRQGADSLLVIGFFVLAAALFPFGVGPEPQILARIAAGVIWVAALLATLLALDRLFHADYEDGGLEQLVLSGVPLPLMVVAKVTAHWLTTGLPLIATSPLLAAMMNLDAAALPALLLALLIGTPSLSLIGAIGAGLVLGSRRGGVLIALLILPLYIPVLIFGVATIDAATFGFSIWPQLKVLSAILILASSLAPWAAAAGIRQALE